MPTELFRLSAFWTACIDQLRVIIVAATVFSLTILVIMMLCLQEFLTLRSGVKYFRAWAPTLNAQCIWLINSMYGFLLSVPLYMLKYFGFSP